MDSALEHTRIKGCLESIGFTVGQAFLNHPYLAVFCGVWQYNSVKDRLPVIVRGFAPSCEIHVLILGHTQSELAIMTIFPEKK